MVISPLKFLDEIHEIYEIHAYYIGIKCKIRQFNYTIF